MMRARLLFLVWLTALMRPAFAGPPYFSDDPEPTDLGHFEIYAFGTGTALRQDTNGAAGIDFNYGAAPDLQLTAVLSGGFDSPAAGATTIGLANTQLAAKYRFLHQETFGWDVSVFPRVFLPTDSPAIGPGHASFLLPIWLEKDWDAWSTFGGGGCEINRGGGSQDFCQAGWALTRQVLPRLQLGAEFYYQTATTRGTGATTGMNVGASYDLSDNYHLLASMGPVVVQDSAETNQYSWYIAMLFTF